MKGNEQIVLYAVMDSGCTGGWQQESTISALGGFFYVISIQVLLFFDIYLPSFLHKM